MKSYMLTIMLLFATACSIKTAAQTNVYSKAVGFTTVGLESNKLYFLGMSFESTNSFWDITRQLPTNSHIYTWNKSAQKYESGQIGSINPESQSINRGDGFFISVSEDTYLRLYGHVPESDNFIKDIPRGLTMNSTPYPAPFNFNEAALSEDLRSGDSLLLWDTTIQRYEVYSKKGITWNSTNIVIYPEEGFWIRHKGGDIIWETSKPYTWP